MMWEVETEKTRCLAYVVTVHQQTLGLVDYVCVYVAYGSTACLPMHHIAKITWGISQFRGTIGYGGQTERELAVLTEILLQQIVKAFQYVVAILPKRDADSPARCFLVRENRRAMSVPVASV